MPPPPRTSLPLDLFEELPRDQELHDLVRARADPHEARVAEDRLHREVGRVADPAQDLHRVVHDLPDGLGGEELGHRALALGRHARVDHLRRPIDQLPRGVEARVHLGELEGDALEGRDRLLELDALGRVFRGDLERAARAAERRHAVGDALGVELDTERVTYCMASLGSARRALEIAAEYSTKRVQFKQPIATFEGVSFKLAEMYTCLDAARQLIYRTAKMIDAGVPAQRESAVTKLFTAEAVWKVVDHAMQVLGGIGYTTDFPVQAIFRNARLMRIGAGSDEIMKFLIARELLKEVKG